MTPRATRNEIQTELVKKLAIRPGADRSLPSAVHWQRSRSEAALRAAALKRGGRAPRAARARGYASQSHCGSEGVARLRLAIAAVAGGHGVRRHGAQHGEHPWLSRRVGAAFGPWHPLSRVRPVPGLATPL